MAETFKLQGTITISKDEALRALGETSEKAKETQSTLETIFDNIGSYAERAGGRIGEAFKWGFEQIKQFTIDGMNISGQVEQGVGGAEAVFGEHCKTIEAEAKNAYKNMGLSVAEYYTNANKMGSLFIGMGYSQAEAAEMTVNSMQRAADVAAIMGIDLEWAMYSVAGMAKGNYMMMDNLGVAMNQTTLEAYALEMGIEKSWKEMTKAEQIGVAYAMFLNRTSYAMGRYTEENNTYSGSINTAKAAWKNFISGQMSMEEAFPHIKNAFDIAMDRLEEILPHIVTGLKTLMDMLTPYLPEIIEKISPPLIDAFTTLLKGVLNNLPTIIKEVLPALSESFAALITATLDMLGLGWLIPNKITVGNTEVQAPSIVDYFTGSAPGKGTNMLLDLAKGRGESKSTGDNQTTDEENVDGFGVSSGTFSDAPDLSSFKVDTVKTNADGTYTYTSPDGAILTLNKDGSFVSYEYGGSTGNGGSADNGGDNGKVNYTDSGVSGYRNNYRNPISFGKPGASVIDVLGQYVTGKVGGLMGGDMTPLATQLASLNAKLDTVINYQAQGKTIVLNTGALVGGIGGAVDQYLGKTLTQKTRG